MVNLVRRNLRMLVQPTLQVAAFVELMDNAHLAGYQEKMQRGTFQSNELNKFGGEIGAFITDALASAKASGGQVINHFLNCNKGVEPGRWHRDKPTEAWRNTGRFILYYMLDGKRACLRCSKLPSHLPPPLFLYV